MYQNVGNEPATALPAETLGGHKIIAVRIGLGWSRKASGPRRRPVSLETERLRRLTA